MPPLLSYVFAAIATFVFFTSANPPQASAAVDGESIVRTHVRWGLFATTEPVIATLRFSPRAGAGEWMEADGPALVSSEADLSHVITIAEVTPCVAHSSTADDGAVRAAVQWTSDEGRHWNDLTNAPLVASPVEQAGLHSRVLSLRYRAHASADACTMRVGYTALPAR